MIKTDNPVITKSSSPWKDFVSPIRNDFSVYTADSQVDFFPVSLETFLLSSDTPIPDSKLSLRHSLLVQIEATPDGFIMKSGYVDEESFGATLDEAYVDFLASLRDRYVSLNRRVKSLSAYELSILEKLRSLLE